MSDWILVTGFGPFPGVKVNPTQTLAERLAEAHFQGLKVVSRVLDVSFERAAEQLIEGLSDGWPRFMVHFGVATGSDRVRVETQGVNRKSASIPDVDGQKFEAAVVHAGHPLDAVLYTSMPAEKVAASLNELG